jgi:membrane fusion protein (multidrug efflux system)
MPTDARSASLPGETAEAPTARRDALQKQPDPPARIPSAPTSAPRALRRRLLRWVLFAVFPLVLVGGAYSYITCGHVMSTDDAYVNAEMVGIPTDISGIVQQIDATENQHVDVSRSLDRLDPSQFQIAVDHANLAQTTMVIASMTQDYGRMQSDDVAQQAQVALDQATYARDTSLVGKAPYPRPPTTRRAYTTKALEGQHVSTKYLSANYRQNDNEESYVPAHTPLAV